MLKEVDAALDRYFKALEQFGYKKDTDVYKLLVLVFIEEMLSGELRHFITEEDYRVIDKALTCLYGTSCLIPWPVYSSGGGGIAGAIDKTTMLRYTEDTLTRVTENGVLRYKASDNYD